MDNIDETNVRTRRDSALVAQAKEGNESATDQLILKYWPHAYRTAARILRCHADAEEAAQDVLYLAIAHLSTFREDASFYTWIHRITVNRSLMVLRRRHSKARAATEVPLECVAAFLGGIRTPEQLLIESERRTMVREGLESLPERYSSVLQLSAIEGRSTSEIAASVGVSAGAVKTRLHRGRARLRRAISRSGRQATSGKRDSHGQARPCPDGAEAIFA